MNSTDPVKFCTSCQCCKPRAGFHVLHHTANRRAVCEECYQRRLQALEKVKT